MVPGLLVALDSRKVHSRLHVKNIYNKLAISIEMAHKNAAQKWRTAHDKGKLCMQNMIGLQVITSLRL